MGIRSESLERLRYGEGLLGALDTEEGLRRGRVFWKTQGPGIGVTPGFCLLCGVFGFDWREGIGRGFLRFELDGLGIWEFGNLQEHFHRNKLLIFRIE